MAAVDVVAVPLAVAVVAVPVAVPLVVVAFLGYAGLGQLFSFLESKYPQPAVKTFLEATPGSQLH